jgi:hypothetical protein
MRRALVALLAAGSLITISPASALATIKPTVKPMKHLATVKPAADTADDQQS